MVACTQYQVVDSNNNIIYEGEFTPDTDKYCEWHHKFLDILNEMFGDKFDRNLKMIYRISGYERSRNTGEIVYVDSIFSNNFSKSGLAASISQHINTISRKIHLFGYLTKNCKGNAEFIDKIEGNE
jgi:hypothetical protein